MLCETPETTPTDRPPARANPSESGAPTVAKPRRAATPRKENANAFSLGKNIEDFVGHSPASSRAVSRFRLQRYAATLTNHGGLRSCFWNIAHGAAAVAVRGVPNEAGGYDKPRLGHLTVCGSHLCPVCAPRVANTRREEVAGVIDWANATGLFPVLLTLTTAHTKADPLAALVSGQKAALRRWRQHRTFKAVRPDIVGTVSAFETTHGANGWHPHAHLLLLVRAPTMGRALRIVARLRAAWRAACMAEGLHTGRAGFKAQAAHRAAGYMAKWDAADELTAAPAKAAKRGGRAPAQLLRDAYQGDAEAAALWAEYAAAMKGRSVLRFSPGLKALAGLLDPTDEEAATPPEEEAARLIDLIASGVWEEAKGLGLDRNDLLRHAAADGRDGVREYLAALRVPDLIEKPPA